MVLAGRSEFVSLPGHLAKYPWVLPTFEYRDPDDVLANLASVIASASSKQRELTRELPAQPG